MLDLKLTIPGTEDESLTLTAAQIAEWLSFGPQGSDVYAARIDATAAAGPSRRWPRTSNREPVSARIGVAAGGGLGASSRDRMAAARRR
jgi:hypothetical protein